jgi:hypothetical protein
MARIDFPDHGLGDHIDWLADLTMCCGTFLGLGRTLAVIGVRAPDTPIEI